MKQLLSYFFTILLWIAALILALTGVTPWVVIALALLHFVELVTIGLSTGLKYGTSVFQSILMCMLFGFFWWLPLRKQMRSEIFTDADFVREG